MMSRITGTIPFRDVQNLSTPALEEQLVRRHRELVDKNGFGLLHTTREQNGDIAFTFDYADGFTMASNELVADELLTPEQVVAIHHARVVLANSSGVKQVPDGASPTGSSYEPLTDDKDSPQYDPAAAAVCRDINVLDQLLEPYETQGKVSDRVVG